MDTAHDCPASLAAAAGTGGSADGGSVLLIVDDEPSILRAIDRLLTTEGYVVHLASGETEAIDCAKRFAAPPHLVVMDLWMSPTSGADLAKAMMAKGIASKFLFISASAVDHGRLPGPLLEKPFSAERFLELISDLLAC
jgi:DNA-binding NtrC family response regulator